MEAVMDGFRVKFWGAAALALVALAATGCGDEGHASRAGSEAAAVPVRTLVAALERIPVSAEQTGSIEPWRRVSPGTKILGRIGEVRFREGDAVRAGQVVVRLEKRDLEAAVEQARAAMAMAEATLDNAGRQYERMKDLHERRSVTPKSLEDATAAFLIAEAGVEQARANLAAAEVTLGYADIRSPVNGWIVSKQVEAGDMASPGMPLFTVEELSRVKVVLRVPESDVVGLEVGDPARVRVDVLDKHWDAEIDRIVPAGDTMSRTYEVQLALSNTEGRLKSGMFARATFERGSREALLVPAEAIVARGQLRGVYVVEEDGRARLRWVRQGRDLDGRAEILSGLAPGERFVTEPPAGLRDGATVEAR
jgi:RND family efflux transporter MFP subunit